MTNSRCRLYLITPPAFEPGAFVRVLEDALAGGDVACVQLRLKDAADEAVLAAGRLLMPAVQAAGAAFLINDRPDLARALGADGVHVGQEDMPYDEARRIVGKEAIVGVTCHDSRHLAMEAAEAGADYVAFGAMFPTSTKAAKTRATPDLIRWWSELFETPCVAIGGITAENAPALVEAGADFLAVSAGVWDHAEGPRAAVRRFNAVCGA
ncbi:MAG: thiamine phosphate synthase [Alphaproteobacteria bacterium]|nr:thiamine phosphate synthase [Alphaproteobacteria bacterium]